MTLDCHIDIPWILTKKGPFKLNHNNEGDWSAVDFPRMRKGGLNSAFFALYLSPNYTFGLNQASMIRLLRSQVTNLLTQDGCFLVSSAGQARQVVASDRIAIFLGLENGRYVDNLDRLTTFRNWGVRYLTFTHNENNHLGNSATAPFKLHKGGLSIFGLEVLKRCNELGIIPDVSHAAPDTAEAIIEGSEKPVIASHSGCNKVFNHSRNLSDIEIKTIAKTGGVVHICFVDKFLGATSIFDHIDHAVQLVGPDHVGIGSDLDGATTKLRASDVANWSTVVKDTLSKKGYSDEHIDKIAGENTLRLLD
jgi:membrane dipeptidase